MQRYFFNIYDGVSLPDGEGTELPDLKSARTQAINLAGRVLADEVLRREVGDNWHLEVTDATGLVFFRLDFHMSDAPAASRDSPIDLRAANTERPR